MRKNVTERDVYLQDPVVAVSWRSWPTPVPLESRPLWISRAPPRAALAGLPARSARAFTSGPAQPAGRAGRSRNGCPAVGVRCPGCRRTSNPGNRRGTDSDNGRDIADSYCSGEAGPLAGWRGPSSHYDADDRLHRGCCSCDLRSSRPSKSVSRLASGSWFEILVGWLSVGWMTSSGRCSSR
jgi:hypothetical protein